MPRRLQNCFDLRRDTMIVRHRQGAVHLVLPRLTQHQAGKGGARTGRQPPGVVIVPTRRRQLLAHLMHQGHAAPRTRQPTAAFRHRLQSRVLRLPGRPKARCMPRPITGKAQPMQVHAIAFKVQRGRGLLRVAAQQTDRRKIKALARRRQRMQMVRMSPAQADQTLCACGVRGCQVLGELEPLVATDQWVDLVQAQDRHLDTGLLQPIQV